MSILSAFKSSITILVLLMAIAVPVHATVTTTGDVYPGGATDPWAIGDNLYVGKSAAGTLDVEAGGVVSNPHGYLGYYSGSTGEATVIGAGSQWNNSGVLSVGRYGDGTLNVTDGGLVSNTNYGFIGRYSGSTGEATVTGANSQWNNSNDLWIGGTNSAAGGAGTLNLYDSAWWRLRISPSCGTREHLTSMAAV